MYNKLFTKILDSSIWLESVPTRLLWITLLAAMDEEGMCQFASIGNLAHRARMSKEDAEAAIACLESPDPDSSDPEHEGRRIERVPGGWMVLNAGKYRDLVTREVAKEKTRVRVARFREGKRAATVGNGSVTLEKRSVTPSEAAAETEAKAKTAASTSSAPPTGNLPDAEWIDGLQKLDAYRHLNVTVELQKAQVWASNNKRVCTRKFFTNWINRAADNSRPIQPAQSSSLPKPAPKREDRFGDPTQDAVDKFLSDAEKRQ